MPLTVPNVLTLLRIALIPLLGLAFLLPAPWANNLAVCFFTLAAITDWLDGYLARKLNQTSAFGAFLDPVADKLIVAVALVALVAVHGSSWFAVPAAIIIGREIAVSALREWMAELGQRGSVKVNVIGKIKTVTQMVAIIVLLFGRDVGDFPLQGFGLALLYLAAALTLYSMIVYLRAALRVVDEEGA